VFVTSADAKASVRPTHTGGMLRTVPPPWPNSLIGTDLAALNWEDTPQQRNYARLEHCPARVGGIMNRVMSLGAAALMTAGAAAACSSATTTVGNSAATGTASATRISGVETITGAVTGAAAVTTNAVIPLTWRGPVNTTSTFSTAGSAPTKGQQHTFTTAAGNFTVTVSAKTTNVGKLLSANTCQFEFVTTVPYTLDGSASTGKFAGATGSGAVVVTFRAYLPKLSNGTCNESSNVKPLTQGAVASFKGGGPLTIRG
jgi:hypothetical protein